MSTIVVIPTYNEVENLPLMVEALFALNIPDLSLLVVDDNSPDGTGQLADQIASENPLTLLLANGLFVSITEAQVVDYPRALLARRGLGHRRAAQPLGPGGRAQLGFPGRA